MAMFADVTLAARLERAEARLSADIAEAILRGGREPTSFVEPIGGGVAVFAGRGSPINKVIGLGFDGTAEPPRLDAVEALFAARLSPVQTEVATLADPALHAALGARGYRLAGFEHVLGLALSDPLPDVDEAISVAECGAHDAAHWLDVVVTGFEHPDDVPAAAVGQEFAREALERVFGDLAATPGFHRYLARAGGTVAGGASMRVVDGVAQLCGAATLPTFRRRGVQTALLASRLRDARRAGCDVAVVTTAPGSKSQQNAQRRGFSLLYARALHVLASDR